MLATAAGNANGLVKSASTGSTASFGYSRRSLVGLVRQHLGRDIDRHIGGDLPARRASKMRAFALEPLPNSISAAPAGMSRAMSAAFVAQDREFGSGSDSTPAAA